MIDKTFDFLFSKKCPKPPIFGVKKFIISLFLVRFHFRLIHMTALLILHVTKEKNIQKVLYTIVQSNFLAVFVTFGNLFQIEMGIIQKV